MQLNTFVAIKLSADLYKATNQTQHLYGADILITYDLLMELLQYETKVHGLNLTHSQDKDYVFDIVHSANVILDSKYLHHWLRIKTLTDGRAEYMIDSIKTYINILSESQHDTYTNPFEIVAPNIGK